MSATWRRETANAQMRDLADLEDLQSELGALAADGAADAELIDVLRGRIEILSDEIDIHLGIEPPPWPVQRIPTLIFTITRIIPVKEGSNPVWTKVDPPGAIGFLPTRTCRGLLPSWDVARLFFDSRERKLR